MDNFNSNPPHVHPQSSSAGYESAIIGEAHGLITDMLADSSLPRCPWPVAYFLLRDKTLHTELFLK